MLLAVTVLGILFAALGAACVVMPDRFRTLLTAASRRGWIAAAVALRVVVGLLLLRAAALTALPQFTFFLGIVLLISGVIAPLVGYARLVALTTWWASRSTLLLRLWATIAIVLGLLLVYAATSPQRVETPGPTMRAGDAWSVERRA